MASVREASARGFPAVVGDAQHLPFAAQSFEKVMCNHVLYHVPDQRAALRELRRIARAGATVLVATNGIDTLREFADVARQAGRDMGFELAASRRSPFTLEDTEVVLDVFPTARVQCFENRLVFPDPEPALDYMRSWIGGTGPLERAMRRRISEVIDRDGAFRVATIAGCFVATV
jgi:SAM-dependent methyltransferase